MIDVEALHAAERQMMIRGMFASAVFAVLLALGVGVTSFAAGNAGHRADKAIAANALALRTFCEDVNASRATQIQLWEHIVNLNPSPTEAQKRTTEDFMKFVRVTFAPETCP